MYISLNSERIIFNCNPSPVVKMSGPDTYYFVELKEYPKNDDIPRHLESYKIATKEVNWRKTFEIPIEFYFDFEVNVSKYIDGYGVQKIFVHRFCDYGKLVKFFIKNDNLSETAFWLERVKKYCEIHGCIPLIETQFDELNKLFDNYYNVNGLDIYKTYNIGRFPKSSTDFRTLDHRKQGVIWYGNWKTFWSYQHPRNWNELSSQEIVDDILGLSE